MLMMQIGITIMITKRVIMVLAMMTLLMIITLTTIIILFVVGGLWARGDKPLKKTAAG